MYLSHIFAANNSTQTWTFSSSTASNFTYNNGFLTIDNSGAAPVANANYLLNPSFSNDNTNWENYPILPEGWIEISGDTTYGTEKFLVMKYEAKAWDTQSDSIVTEGGASSVDSWAGNNGQTRYRAVSVPEGKPWVRIPQNDPTYYDTTEACAALGATYHLITNAEWMTLARKIEAQSSNWSGGSVGNGYLFAGHNDGDPDNPLAASSTDTGDYTCAYTDSAGTTEAPAGCPTFSANGTSGNVGIQKRVHTISNGQSIWDFAGNVWEFTSDTVTEANGPDVSGQSGFNNREYTAITDYGSLSYDLLRPTNALYDSTYGIGKIYSNSNSAASTEYAFLRGGNWDRGTVAGIFATAFNVTPTNATSPNRGFRCTSDPISVSQTYSASTGRTGGGNTVSVGNVIDLQFSQSVNVGSTDTFLLEAYVYDKTSGNDGGTINSTIAELFYNDSAITTTYTNAGNGWWKLSGTLTGANQVREYGLLIKKGKTITVDDFTLAKSGPYSVYTTTAYTNATVSSWDSFTASVTTPGNSSVKFQICTDDGATCESNSTWKYWDGDSWETASNTTTHTNTASQLTQSAMSSLSVASQKISVKAVFNFTGIHIPSLQNIQIGFTDSNLDAFILTAVSSSVTETAATITWLTDDQTSSQVEYGLTTSYGTQTTETDTSPRVTNHSVTITGLNPCTTYQYRARSTDGSNNTISSSAKSFTTAGCAGSASVTAQNQSTITTASGGNILLIDSGVGLTLQVPSAFAGADANFQIKKLEKTAAQTATAAPTDKTLVANYLYDLKALSAISTTVTSFNNPITVSVTYNASEVSGFDVGTLKIWRWDGSAWHELTNCVRDDATRTLSCTTTEFSVFGLFGVGSNTQTNTTAQNSSGGNSNSSPSGPPACTNQIPGSAPELFQIDRVGSAVRLHITAGSNPYTDFAIYYGVGAATEQYATFISYQNASGVIVHEVYDLDPKQPYSFKVQPLNGCMPGPWSNTLAVGKRSGKYFKLGLTQFTTRIKGFAPKSTRTQ